jgi:hypothetical protein
MSNKPEETENKKILPPSLDPNHEDFNFDVWAGAVRRQMLTVVQANLGGSRPKTLTSQPSELAG